MGSPALQIGLVSRVVDPVPAPQSAAPAHRETAMRDVRSDIQWETQGARDSFEG